LNKNLFRNLLIFFLIVLILSGCFSDSKNQQKLPDLLTLIPDSADVFIKIIPVKSEIALKLESLGLVDIKDIDNTIEVDLIYSTTENFTGQILYEGLSEAYFQQDVAVKLSNAQKYLQDTLSGAKLLIYDAARPLSVQKAMWENVKNSRYRNYVANPDRTSLHNYGVAVDLTIIDSNGMPLDMGTPIDFFGKAAGNYDEILILEGLITPQHSQNRQLLQFVMKKAGFYSIPGEWWHFNACSLYEAKQKYNIIE